MVNACWYNSVCVCSLCNLYQLIYHNFPNYHCKIQFLFPTYLDIWKCSHQLLSSSSLNLGYLFFLPFLLNSKPTKYLCCLYNTAGPFSWSSALWWYQHVFFLPMQLRPSKLNSICRISHYKYWIVCPPCSCFLCLFKFIIHLSLTSPVINVVRQH